MQTAMRLATADGDGHDDGAVELLAGAETRATRMWLCDCGAICDADCDRCGCCGAHRPGAIGRRGLRSG